MTDREIERLIDLLTLPQPPEDKGGDAMLAVKLAGILQSRRDIRAMPKPCGEIVLPGGGVAILGTVPDHGGQIGMAGVGLGDEDASGLKAMWDAVEPKS